MRRTEGGRGCLASQSSRRHTTPPRHAHALDVGRCRDLSVCMFRFELVALDFLQFGTSTAGAVRVSLRDRTSKRVRHVITSHLKSGASASDEHTRISTQVHRHACWTVAKGGQMGDTSSLAPPSLTLGTPSHRGGVVLHVLCSLVVQVQGPCTATNNMASLQEDAGAGAGASAGAGVVGERCVQVNGLREWYGASGDGGESVVLAMDANSHPELQGNEGEDTVWTSFPAQESVWGGDFDAAGQYSGKGGAPPVTVNKMRGPESQQASKIGAHAHFTIDHVYHRNALLLGQAEALPVPRFASPAHGLQDVIPSWTCPSDHYPVVVDFD